ncbi:GNAT family N-acetyltransferase [Ruminococcaceae bacterium OttesenSCG-928-N02]|nr:GNAT family N-acetyltransferase [Ruminococcaceae bacterium OttesenSCG-928-N02]
MQTEQTGNLLEIQPIDETLAREIYKNSMQRDFPAQELRPLRGMLSLYKKGLYSGLAAYSEGALVAYAFFGGKPGAESLLLDYYAVQPNVRGQGVGGRFLKQIQQALGQSSLLIEAENPAAATDENERATRAARVRFYEHAGATDLHLRWLLFGVEYTVLHLPCAGGVPYNEEQAKHALRNVYHGLVPKHLPGYPRFLA